MKTTIQAVRHSIGCPAKQSTVRAGGGAEGKRVLSSFATQADSWGSAGGPKRLHHLHSEPSLLSSFIIVMIMIITKERTEKLVSTCVKEHSTIYNNTKCNIVQYIQCNTVQYNILYTIYTIYTHNNVQYIQVRVAVVVVYQPTHWSFLYMIFWYRDLN